MYFTVFKFSYLKKFRLIFLSSFFVIRVNLLHPQPFLFLYVFLVSLKYFSILAKDNVQVSFNVNVILYGAKITGNAVTKLL